MKKQYLILLLFLLSMASLCFYMLFGKKQTEVERTITSHSVGSLEISFLKNESNFKHYIIDASSNRICRLHSKDNIEDIKRSHYFIEYLDDDAIESFKNTFSFDLPKNAEVKFVDSNSIYYYYRFGLYIQRNNVDSLISPMNTSIYDVFFLENKNIFCLGEIEEGNKYMVCFFELNPNTNEIIKRYSLEENSISTKSKNLLTYSGRFCINQNELSYVFERKGLILFFNHNNGLFIRNLSTIDKNPNPTTTLTYGNNTTYKRGEAKLSNSGVLKYNDEIFSFSTFPLIRERLMIDVYKSGKYRNSLKVNLDKINSMDIRFLKQSNSKTFLGTKKKLYILNNE